MKKLLLAAAAAVSLPAGANAALIYGVNETNNLVLFDSAAPSTYLSSIKLTGIDGSLEALDFRPLDNTLFGLSLDKEVYRINVATGVATRQTGSLAIQGSAFAFDFNPTIDRVRIVSNTNQNYVYNPNTSSLQATATNVAYASGDVNFGRNPDVTAAAYTSSTFGAAADSTQLYVIDTANNVLARQANNAGTLTTVGALGFDFGSRTSFDILGPDAFAQNATGFYRIDLTTGAASRIGDTPESLFGIAIAAVPEPATWAMMIGGIGAMGGMLRRRRVTTRVRFA